MKRRQYTIIILFVAITLGVSIYSFFARYDDSSANSNPSSITKGDEMDESYFKVVDYYLVDKSKPFLRLQSTELTLKKQNSEVVGFNPDGVIYRRDENGVEEDPIFFNSKNSRVLTANKELYLQDEVEVKVANSTLKSDKVTIFNGGRHLEADGNVSTESFDPKTNDQILITSNFALYRPKSSSLSTKETLKARSNVDVNMKKV